MNISIEGLEFIKKHEGLRLRAYLDSGGVATIGYGHTFNVKIGDEITEQEAELFLIEDTKSAVSDVNNHLYGVKLNQNQFDALVSLTFNLGGYQLYTKQYQNGYNRGSTLYNLLLEGNFSGAVDQFTAWIKVNGVSSAGLLKRRKDEQELFKKKMILCTGCNQSL